MSDHGDEPNAERPPDDPEKRSRTLSQKGLQYAVERKRRQTITTHKRLQEVIRSDEEADNSHITESVVSNLVTTAEQFKAVLQELKSLYEQDKYNEVEGKSPLEQSNKRLESRSRNSRHSHRSRSLSSASTTSSAARIKALAEAAAARENAEYEKNIAGKEHARKETKA